MMIMKRLLFLVSVCSLCMVGNSQNYQPEKHAVVKSDRGDGRLLSTYAIVHEMLKDTHPQYAYRSGMSAQDFTQWQDGVRAAMVEIMKFPEIKGQPSPVCVKTEKKEGIYFREMGVLSFSKVSFHFSGFETGTFEGCSTRSLVHSGFRKDQRRIGR